METPKFVLTDIAKEAQRDHPGSQCVNLLLVPHICVRFWLPRMPKKAHFGRTFLDLFVQVAVASARVSWPSMGRCSAEKFDKLHDIASRPVRLNS